MEGLRKAKLLERLEPLPARSATKAELQLCHSVEYLQTAEHDVRAGYHHLTTGDTEITANSWDLALLGAGGVLNAVDAVMEGRVRNAFCAVRPPGHHAMPVRGMGFC